MEILYLLSEDEKVKWDQHQLTVNELNRTIGDLEHLLFLSQGENERSKHLTQMVCPSCMHRINQHEYRGIDPNAGNMRESGYTYIDQLICQECGENCSLAVRKDQKYFFKELPLIFELNTEVSVLKGQIEALKRALQVVQIGD